MFISRRNLLQTAVSGRIARQAQLWNRWDASPERPLEQYYDSLRPLDLDDLRDYVRKLALHLHWAESVLNLRDDSRTLQLRYEDLCFTTPQSQRAQLCAIWSFLELPRSAHRKPTTTSIPRQRSWAAGNPMAGSRTRPRLMRPTVPTRSAGCSPWSLWPGKSRAAAARTPGEHSQCPPRTRPPAKYPPI